MENFVPFSGKQTSKPKDSKKTIQICSHIKVYGRIEIELADNVDETIHFP